MAITTTFSVTRDDIINRALRLCGAYDATNPPTSTDYSNISLAFNMLIKAWIRQGVPQWKIVETVLPMIVGNNTYQVGPYATGTGALVTPKMEKVFYAFLRNTNLSPAYDIPIEIISLQEYNQYGVKGSLGIVNSMFYQPISDSNITNQSSFVKVYPTPSLTGYEVHMFNYQVLNDVSIGTDPIDFPQETYNATSWCLANEISMEYATSMDRVQEIKQRAAQWYQEMIDWSTENAETIRFMYDTRSR